jgi:predicted amidophosphoribosyltransferase
MCVYATKARSAHPPRSFRAVTGPTSRTAPTAPTAPTAQSARRASSGFPQSGRAAVPIQHNPAANMERRFAICSICHGPARPGCSTCWSCLTVRVKLGRPLWPVVPLFLVAPRSAAHNSLVAYKASASREIRRRASDELARTVGEWLGAHAACLLGDQPASSRLTLVPVPSSSGGRPSWGATHPVDALWRRAVATATATDTPSDIRVRPVLSAGPEPPSRLSPRTDGFVVTETRLAPPVVVVDDLFVSGARAMSAAAALERAGIRVRAVVPVARFVRPDHNDASMAYWSTFGEIAMTIRACAWCVRETAPSNAAASNRSRRPLAWRNAEAVLRMSA